MPVCALNVIYSVSILHACTFPYQRIGVKQNPWKLHNSSTRINPPNTSKLYINQGIALQKQVGCCNHRVVTLVADKLVRLVMKGLLWYSETDWIRQPKGSCPLPLTTANMLLMQAGDSLTDVLRVVSWLYMMNWAAISFRLPNAIRPFNTKANLS